MYLGYAFRKSRIRKSLVTNANRVLNRRADQRVLALHTGRVGSTVMGTMLNQHDKVFWDGELFRRPRVKAMKARLNGKTFDPWQVLQEQLYNTSHTYGFAIKPKHFRVFKKMGIEQVIRRMEEDYGFRNFILFERRNQVRKIISSLMAKKRGRYHLGKDSGPGLVTIHVDPARLIEVMEKQAKELDSLKVMLDSRRTLRLVYEDHILPDPWIGYNEVCDFVKVAPRSGTQVRLQRTNPFHLSEVIENFDEVKDAFAGTSYERMLLEEA